MFKYDIYLMDLVLVLARKSILASTQKKVTLH